MKFNSGLQLRPGTSGGPQATAEKTEPTMDDDLEFSTLETSFDYFVMSPEEELDQTQFLAPNMDRSKLSSSSMDSGISGGSFLDPNYAASPLSSLGSPPSEGDFTRRRSYNEQTQNSFLSPERVTLSRQSSEALPIFNIERDGNPDIQWFMYYDFIVTKAEAYYQLQPSYLPTAKYPTRINSEKVIM